ncbi:MAG: XRE family transcriptional regulator [Acidimicrobiales bacterium]
MDVGKRLRDLREEASLSQARVGEALGLSASQVSRAESGKRQLSAYELGVVAGEFGWDVRDLLGIDRPRTKVAVAARLRSAAGSPTEALRRAADLVEVDSLLDEAGAPDRAHGLTVGSPAPEPVTLEQAERDGEQVAADLRHELRLHGPITDLLALCEGDLGVDVLIAPIGDDDCDGIIAVAENLAIMVIDADTMSGRQRFTIAHELAHGLFGDVVDTVLVDVDRPALVEERAQSFAAAFLLPEEELREVLGATPGPVELAEAMVNFGVSWTALVKRCDRLGVVIDPSLVGMTGASVFERAGRGAEVDRLAAPMPARAPARIVRRVQDAYGAAYIGAGVVSMALGVAGDDLDQVLMSITRTFEVPAPSATI